MFPQIYKSGHFCIITLNTVDKGRLVEREIHIATIKLAEWASSLRSFTTSLLFNLLGLHLSSHSKTLFFSSF